MNHHGDQRILSLSLSLHPSSRLKSNKQHTQIKGNDLFLITPPLKGWPFNRCLESEVMELWPLI